MIMGALRKIAPALLATAALAAATEGCSAAGGGDSAEPAQTVTLAPSGPADSNTGSVGFQLSLPTGQQIPVLSWAVSGPNGAATVVKSGTITTQSQGVTFLVGNLPLGSGYKISLGGTADDGSVVCAGTATFAIANRVTTQVVVDLACSSATDGAHVTLVNGTTFDCAAWNNVSASPTETSVGSSVMLTATASAPSPAAITYNWSAPSGTFGSSTSASTSFTCTSVGAVNVTLVVGDGPVPAGSSCNQAFDTKTVVIQCQAAMQTDAGGGGQDAGAGDGGPPPPPSAAPALPLWGTSALAGVLLALGSMASRRRDCAAR